MNESIKQTDILAGLASLPEAAMLGETALAAALGMTPRTLQRLVKRHELPAGFRLGRRRLWLAGEVLAFLRRKAAQEVEKTEREKARLAKFCA